MRTPNAQPRMPCERVLDLSGGVGAYEDESAQEGQMRTSNYVARIATMMRNRNLHVAKRLIEARAALFGERCDRRSSGGESEDE